LMFLNQLRLFSIDEWINSSGISISGDFSFENFCLKLTLKFTFVKDLLLILP
jgi:hypothetical protein